MTRSLWARFARGSVADWRNRLRLIMAVCRGTYYALFFRLFRRDVVIALPFIAYESVAIGGPGQVRIGRYCSVHANVFRGLSVVTLSPSAVVRIGPHCSLGGLTIRCLERVVIGERTMTAHSLVQDTLLFSASERYWGGVAPISGPIEIGSNAWLGGLTYVLPMAVVGEDSVLSWGAACFDIVLPPASLASGNPVTRTVPIDRVQEIGRTARDLSDREPARLPL
jgi:carbonic anhydrase/acetyltransferase-like protein (isoleucine patch superfamily)